ncbi:hypothetical protein J6590_070921 [Homalodisca vitripennis]|nr:hypothetical protein J6590_070921 [Homalodisca vitripennis]
MFSVVIVQKGFLCSIQWAVNSFRSLNSCARQTERVTSESTITNGSIEGRVTSDSTITNGSVIVSKQKLLTNSCAHQTGRKSDFRFNNYQRLYGRFKTEASDQNLCSPNRQEMWLQIQHLLTALWPVASDLTITNGSMAVTKQKLLTNSCAYQTGRKCGFRFNNYQRLYGRCKTEASDQLLITNGSMAVTKQKLLTNSCAHKTGRKCGFRFNNYQRLYGRYKSEASDQLLCSGNRKEEKHEGRVTSDSTITNGSMVDTNQKLLTNSCAQETGRKSEFRSTITNGSMVDTNQKLLTNSCAHETGRKSDFRFNNYQRLYDSTITNDSMVDTNQKLLTNPCAQETGRKSDFRFNNFQRLCGRFKTQASDHLLCSGNMKEE